MKVSIYFFTSDSFNTSRALTLRYIIQRHVEYNFLSYFNKNINHRPLHSPPLTGLSITRSHQCFYVMLCHVLLL